ncbi:hypothetical protein D187_007722 [Cystobacter fuscus DSM 2262]|uniref:Uncharacterized protein n=1 Tax=Cystobacter fuscus (strain ATCC 25194 / DSM 2262 / NBRC 100088 / M29) TaxID=1242864 RepID=S9NVZ3_CYSF2|nr:hypothetical protein D187_007722 [Cystobacter fuscus DSM 2262]
MSNETLSEQPVNLTELSDEALDDLISGEAQELSNTQAWQ